MTILYILSVFEYWIYHTAYTAKYTHDCAILVILCTAFVLIHIHKWGIIGFLSAILFHHHYPSGAWDIVVLSWAQLASYNKRKIVCCACTGNAQERFPLHRFQRTPLVNDRHWSLVGQYHNTTAVSRVGGTGVGRHQVLLCWGRRPLLPHLLFFLPYISVYVAHLCFSLKWSKSVTYIMQ